MKEKKKIQNIPQTISSRSFNDNYFKKFTSILLNVSFETSKIYLTQKIFSEGFTQTGERKRKRKYDYCK